MSSDQTRPQGSSPTAPPLVAKKPEEPKQPTPPSKQKESAPSEDQRKEVRPNQTKDKLQSSEVTSTKRSASRSRSRDREKGRRDRQGVSQQNRQSERNGDRNDRDRMKRREFNSRLEEQNKNTTYFKTKMCPAFLNGRCIKEGRCTFAHGAHELREMPNFKKTKLCNEYLRGECPFSSRQCKYAHGESELKRHATNQQHRAEYQAEMKKYQVSSYDYAPPPPTVHYGVPPPTYHHPAIRGSSHGSVTGYPPPATGHYPPMGHGSSHVQPFITQLPHHYDRPGYANPPPSTNWSGYPSGSWIPPARSQPGPYGPISNSFSGFDPITSPLPYRHLDFGTPGSNVNVSRSGQVPMRDIVPPPPNSNFGSGGMSSNFSTSGTFTATSGPFSGSSSSNLYSTANVGSYASGNPSNSSANTNSGPFLPYLTGNNGNSFDTFQMSLNESIPRRMPLPPS